MPAVPPAAPALAAPRSIPRYPAAVVHAAVSPTPREEGGDRGEPPTDKALLHARFDGPVPARERAAAAFGSTRNFEVARAGANVGFFKGHVRASLARIRRARRALGDPTHTLCEIARLEARLAAAVTDLHFGLRQFRAQNRHFWRLVGQGDDPSRAIARTAAPDASGAQASPAAPLPAPPPLPPKAPLPEPWSRPIPPLPAPVPPELRLLRRPTHTVDDGTRFWLFAGRADADAFATAHARRHAGRVYTLSELGTLGVFGRGGDG